jgi:putative ABC transport system ATP-binding protein
MSLLEIRDLIKSYRTPDGEVQTVLDVPAFALEEKEHVALRGTSGTGKTTLLNCIAGILSPDSGHIELAGCDMAVLGESARDRHRADNIGYIFQTFNLLQGYTCLENVLLGMSFGPGKDRARARELLTRVGLEDRLNYRPSQLSVGQQQRVAVARALANQPQLVLADEPTGNLDPRNGREALKLIREICGETDAALLLVSHDQEVLNQFDECRDLAEINQAMREVSTT